MLAKELKIIKPNILENIVELNTKFSKAKPFKNCCIDDFFEEGFIQSLIDDFPKPGPDYDKFCLEDGGKIGSNYANGVLDSFPNAYRKLNDLVKCENFIRLLEMITGINGLNYDPDYFGGGIRESREKTFLPIHLDFNYHPKTRYHRRLNLLLYLNREWQDNWGGSIQVHKDPFENPGCSLVSEYLPIANRVFIFETSEVSWHGFSRLRCPPLRGRKAFSIYYYTETRPEGEIPPRNTEYVEPWLPNHIGPGMVLSEDDFSDLKELLKRRDDRIKMLYDMRRSFDGKYSHLWKEYEYYLHKYRELSEEKNL